MSMAQSVWVHERTFGRRAGDFWWQLDDDGALLLLSVRRDIGDVFQKVRRVFPTVDIERLLEFMADGAWQPLAGSHLRDPLPPVGLAPFVRHILGRSVDETMSTTYIATVFSQAGLWEWRQVKRRLEFRQVDADLARLAAYFARRQATPGRRPPSERAAPSRQHHGSPPPPGFDLAAHFRARARELQGRLEALDAARDLPEKGRRREAVLRQFLRAHLPQRFAVGTGEVATPWGEMSRQADILIYDALHSTPLLGDAESLVVPVESVYAVIEVKPRLNTMWLREAIAAVRSVKALRIPDGPGPPIFGAVIACQTPPPKTLARSLHADQRDNPPHLWLDALCILHRAIMHRQGSLPGPGGWSPDMADSPTALACVEAGVDSLLYFMLLLQQDLRYKTLAPPDLLAYATGLRFPEPDLL